MNLKQRTTSLLVSLCAIIVIIALSTIDSHVSAAAPSPLTMTQRASLQLAVGNAMKTLSTTNDWKYALSSSSIEFSNIEKCEPDFGYPKTLDLPKDTIVLCKNNDATIPWITSNTTGYYFTFAELVQQQLNKQYKKNFKLEWVDVDVSSEYFPPMRDAVNQGQCHMVISYTILNANRSQEVDFGCAHSAGRSGILRSSLEPGRTLDNLEKLSDPTVNVGVVRGAVNIRPEKANITIVSSIEEGFHLIKTNQLHAFLFTEVTVNSWVKTNCDSCRVYPYGPVTQYAVFFKQGAEFSSAITVPHLTTLFATLLLASIMFILSF